MLEIPRRISLTSQIAAALRKGIEEGVWEEYLPGERRLCDTFQASRPTVRAALRTLAKDGWCEIRQGRRTRLRAKPARRRILSHRRVGIIVHEPYSHLGSTLAQGLGEMRVRLAQQGFTTEVYACLAHGTRAQQRGLENFRPAEPDRLLHARFGEPGRAALVQRSIHTRAGARLLPSLGTAAFARRGLPRSVPPCGRRFPRQGTPSHRPRRPGLWHGRRPGQ